MCAGWNFVEFINKNRALRTQAVDNKFIVDDFVPYINRRAMLFERKFDNFDGAINARAKAARGCEQYFKGRAGIRLFSHVQGHLGNVEAKAKAFPLLQLASRADKDAANGSSCQCLMRILA